MASIGQQPLLEVERVAELLLVVVMLTALATALLAVMTSGMAAAARWIRRRRSSLVPGESMFVGRWGRAGPELFVVGAGARRLLPAEGGGKADVARRAAGEVGPVLAARMLLETLGRRPSRELTWAFTEERLTHLPADGFTLPTSEVIAWLDARHAAGSERGRRALGLAGAGAALVASWLRPATRSRIEGRVPGAREAARDHGRENRAGPARR